MGGDNSVGEVMTAQPTQREELGRTCEYHLQWRKNRGTWYFGGVCRTNEGAIMALRIERKKAAKNDEDVEWRIVEQIKERRVIPVIQ